MGILIDGLIHGETSATVVTEKYFKESAYSGTYTLDFTGENYNKALSYLNAEAAGVGVTYPETFEERHKVMRFCNVNEFCPPISLRYFVIDPTITITGATGVGSVFGSGYKWYYLKLERNSLYYPLKLEVNFSNLPASGSAYHPVQQYTGNGTMYAGLYFFSGMTGMQTASTSYAVGYLNITGTDNCNGYGRLIGREETSNNINSHTITAVPESHLFVMDIGEIYNGESGITVTYGGSASTQTNDSLSSMRFYYTSSGTHSFSGQNEWIVSVPLIGMNLIWDINITDENYKGKVVKARNQLCRNASKTADIYPISVDAHLHPAFWAEAETPFTVKIKFTLQRQPGYLQGMAMVIRSYTGNTESSLSLVQTYTTSLQYNTDTPFVTSEFILYQGRTSPNVYRVTFAPASPMSGTITWTNGTYNQSIAWSPSTLNVTSADVAVEKAFTSAGNGGMSTGIWVNDFIANMRPEQ